MLHSYDRKLLVKGAFANLAPTSRDAEDVGFTLVAKPARYSSTAQSTSMHERAEGDGVSLGGGGASLRNPRQHRLGWVGFTAVRVERHA